MRKLGKLSIRLFSLYIFIKAIISLKDIFVLLVPQLGEEKIVTSVIKVEYLKYYIPNFIIMLIIAVLLWLFTDKIISRMIGKDGEEHIIINIKYDELVNITLKVLGIILVLNAIPFVLTQILNLLTIDINGLDLYMRSILLIKFSEPIIRIVVGIILISRNRPSKDDENTRDNNAGFDKKSE